MFMNQRSSKRYCAAKPATGMIQSLLTLSVPLNNPNGPVTVSFVPL